jgi:hypothetical protein
MKISAWLLVFSYVKYFANDPTSLPPNQDPSNFIFT